jgi:hypothetical protein
MKSSLHSLIPFFSVILPTPETLSIQFSSATASSGTRLNSNSSSPRSSLCSFGSTLTENTLLRVFALAGMCLLSRCLTKNCSGFQMSSHNINPTTTKLEFGCQCLVARDLNAYAGGSWDTFSIIAEPCRLREVLSSGISRRVIR